MNVRRLIAITSFAIGLAGLVAGCSSNNDSNGPKGSLAVALRAVRAASTNPDPGTAATADQGDASSRLRAAEVTMAGVEARMGDGTWVPVETGLPMDIDLIGIMDSGHVATLPADLLPEGSYNALELRITRARLTLLEGKERALTPPGTGWTVLVPVSFSVTAGQATTVNLTLHGASSFKLFDGEIGFDPEFEVKGVEHS
jgi:hypothetical protein